MRDVDRLVSSLIASDVPIERSALEDRGRAIVGDIAPLAPEDAVTAAVDAIVGLGPLEPLLDDPSVTDILVNRPDDIWVERNGILEPASVAFRSADDVIAMVRRVISPLGLRIDRSSPAIDARLPDGSRLHAVIPPASVDAPVVAIRRFVASVGSIADLVEAGAASEDQAAVLEGIVRERANVLVAGPTGAGKTTLLNVLVGAIPAGDRVVTVEDAAELSPPGHVVRLEARSSNVEGAGAVTIRSLLRHALRLRPDRIVVGEVRGAEALDMVVALTTGHRGSMSTIHAHSSDDALVRLETLAAMAPEAVSDRALTGLVESAIDVVVVVHRTPGGRRVEAIDRIRA
jgi:pilus assembly protein CpaF